MSTAGVRLGGKRATLEQSFPARHCPIPHPGVALRTTHPLPRLSHKIRRLRDADHGSGNGRGAGETVTAGQPTSDGLAPGRISFRARTRAALQGEVARSWRVGLPLSPWRSRWEEHRVLPPKGLSSSPGDHKDFRSGAEAWLALSLLVGRSRAPLQG